MSQPVITLLYVPGDRPDRVAKALAMDADVVIVDLADAVRPEAKVAAREGLDTMLAGVSFGRGVQVRVNPLTSEWAGADLAAAARLPVSVGVRVPKCEDPATLETLGRMVGSRPVHVLVQSALGVEAAFELARSSGVASIGLGETDLRADLGVTDDAGLLWARSRVVNAAAAAGLPPPAMSVFPNVADLDGLKRSCEAGRQLGFLGRAAIHPMQLPVIAEAFRF